MSPCAVVPHAKLGQSGLKRKRKNKPFGGRHLRRATCLRPGRLQARSFLSPPAVRPTLLIGIAKAIFYNMQLRKSLACIEVALVGVPVAVPFGRSQRILPATVILSGASTPHRGVHCRLPAFYRKIASKRDIAEINILYTRYQHSR